MLLYSIYQYPHACKTLDRGRKCPSPQSHFLRRFFYMNWAALAACDSCLVSLSTQSANNPWEQTKLPIYKSARESPRFHQGALLSRLTAESNDPPTSSRASDTFPLSPVGVIPKCPPSRRPPQRPP